MPHVAAHKSVVPIDFGDPMANLNNQFAEINQSAVDAAARLSKVSIESAERMFALQLAFAKAALADATSTARAAASTQDPQQLLALRTKSAEAAMSQMIELSRSLYEVASGAQAEFTKLAEERLSAVQRGVTESVDQAAKSAPAGSDVAVAALKSSMAAATAAFDTFSKAARHATSFSDAGVKAASAPKGRK
jgi:phasin family protein